MVGSTRMAYKRNATVRLALFALIAVLFAALASTTGARAQDAAPADTAATTRPWACGLRG